MKINKHTLRCFQQHMGDWMMEEGRFHQLYNFIMSQNIVFEAPDKEAAEVEGNAEQDSNLTALTSGGVLIVPIEGTMMRGQSSFGGTSTVQVRRILRNAARTSKVKAVMLRIDSPGGTVAGTDELASDIEALAAEKPVHAHVDGMMASAAYWSGSKAAHITATRTSEIGSLGTMATVTDTSGVAEKQGVKVHVVSTGPHKGAFTPGTEVTKEHLTHLQNIVNKLNGFFKADVAAARGFSQTQVDALFDGRVHVAEDALDLGLIDGISSFESAVRSLEESVAHDDADAEAALARARTKRRR